jgi:hypothetical protein
MDVPSVEYIKYTHGIETKQITKFLKKVKNKLWKITIVGDTNRGLHQVTNGREANCKFMLLYIYF